jgi:hypothetical protein
LEQKPNLLDPKGQGGSASGGCQLSEMPLADLLGKRPRVIWDILVASVRAQHRSVLQRCDFTAAKMDSFYETTLAHTRSPIPRDIIGAMMVIKSNY